MRWFKGKLAVFGLITSVAAGACFITDLDPAWTDIERSPCSGAASACATYLVCPQGYKCKTPPWWDAEGWSVCTTGTISAPAHVYQQGSPDPFTGCCGGGYDTGNLSSTNCTIPWDILGGSPCMRPWFE
ncbi:MAG: hypothetical protein DYG94_04045 [Leptolyngbya sp. PLA3]|nr:MAG: hypothetical protein EDM82_07855 [Cyanobacteria bacterium CYA]MCE7967902.1 hypothetical protein [Leptolyngbya sp. PL-A3]